MACLVYSLRLRNEGLDEFPADMRSRYTRMHLRSALIPGTCTPEVKHEWTFANTYFYNTCVTLTVAVEPSLLPVSRNCSI
jgi:hypothetical protein